MTKPSNIESIEEATSTPWHEWLVYLATIDAKDMAHKDIASKLVEDKGVSGWWAQSIAVAYEQYIGRRAPGQVADGSYQVSVNRTVTGDMDSTLAAWSELIGTPDEINGVALEAEPTTSSTEKWRYWRCKLSDGSRVTVGIGAKDTAQTKSLVGLAHEKLAGPDQVNSWKTYWKSRLDELSV